MSVTSSAPSSSARLSATSRLNPSDSLAWRVLRLHLTNHIRQMTIVANSMAMHIAMSRVPLR